jgi:hypothetical protein
VTLRGWEASGGVEITGDSQVGSGRLGWLSSAAM